MLHLPQSVHDQLRRHGEAAYPDECCGVLLGSLAEEVRTIREAIAVENASASPRNHYEVSPQDLIAIMSHARSAGLEILGFYHSHPDHPAQPSATDLAEAHWIGCSYVITAVCNGLGEATNSFLLGGSREEDKHFTPEVIVIVPWRSDPTRTIKLQGF
jgi:proteasome lid subunit RPN8/RPN11